ncbi:MAG TPA: dTDP-4-dehydrorhamnose 3,5-epimerase [Anaeromyxobacteraceae bacterium]|nr:dTDP-4-dehydrorhamnose 3,5-epimerase [Anaeromyxobacteraceae bacterium]
MDFAPTSVSGVWLLQQQRHADDRGWFARTWDEAELRERGLEARVVQCSASFNHRRGTLRGLHYQAPPFAEAKVVRCTRGRLFDVAVDLRPDSSTFRAWVGVELTPENGRSLYIPRGCAHGFLTLSDDTEVAYQITPEYSPDHARGVRWDDPLLAIAWPEPVATIAPRDRDYPDVQLSALEELRGI